MAACPWRHAQGKGGRDGCQSNSRLCALGLFGFWPLSLLKMANSTRGRTTSSQSQGSPLFTAELLSSFLSKAGWLTKSQITEGFGQRLIRKISACLRKVPPSHPLRHVHHQLIKLVFLPPATYLLRPPSIRPAWVLGGHRAGAPRAENASDQGRDRNRDPGLQRRRRGHLGWGVGRDVGPELRWAWMTDKTGNRAGKRGSSQVLEPNQEFPGGLTEN